MSQQELVSYHVADRIARVTIERPDKLNALNRAVIAELKEQLARAGADDEVGVILLAGAGEKAFVAGADIAEMADLGAEDARHFALDGQALASVIDGLGKPVIAAIPGFALGGGCELAMMCHLRVAGPKARFGQPEVGLGLIPGFGGTQRLARLVGEGRALELILTGRMIDAKRAFEIGLVNSLAGEDETALEAAMGLAKKILAQGPVAVRLCLEAVRRGLSMPLAEGLAYEAGLFGLVFSTEDMREGTKAFTEKRKPEFKGR